MKNKEDAVKLSNCMKNIGKLSEKETICIITNMDEPLGKTVGNTLEVIEAIEFLNGNMQGDVKEIVLTIGSYMMKLAGKSNDLEKNRKEILETIKTGKALEKFKELVKRQNGDFSYIENINKFPRAKYILEVVSDINGYVNRINAQNVGEISRELGAGRFKKTDKIDHAVGIVLERKVGDYVKKRRYTWIYTCK